MPGDVLRLEVGLRATARICTTTGVHHQEFRRSAHNDRQLLVEFGSQSQRLQAELTGDVERLEEQLTEAKEEVNRVRDNLIALTRTAYDDRERHNLSMTTMESRIKELERKLEASSLEEICLRQAFSQAHAESERLSAAAEDMHKNIPRVVAHDQKRTINTLTQEIEKLKLSHKDTVDRLQLELFQVKAVGANISHKGTRRQRHYYRS